MDTAHKLVTERMHFFILNTSKVLLATSLLAIAGCTVVPGAYHSATPGWFIDQDEDVNAKPLPDVIKVHSINTAILDQSSSFKAPKEVAEGLVIDVKEYGYTVGPGDVLQITVWDHPELTIPAGSQRSSSESGNLIHSDGTIFYPYVGIVHVDGLQVTEIRDLITERLGKYIEGPQVDVSVAAFRNKRIYVTGEVDEPGVYPITNVPMRLVDAIGEAGGILKTADWSRVILTREGKDYELSLREVYQRGNKAHNVLLRPGDVVNVSPVTDAKVFVLGEVGKPSSLEMKRNGLTLAEALAENGGLDQRQSDASGVFVFRKAAPGEEHGIDVYQLNAKDAAALVLADSFHLQQRDIVYVTAAPLAKWNRVLSLILPSVSALFLGSRTEEALRE